MADWNDLHREYGLADDIRTLLARAGVSGDDPAWGDLWTCLCHQGTVCLRSFLALSELAAVAGAADRGVCVQAVLLAGAIVAGEDQPYAEVGARRRYAGPIDVLAGAAEELMRTETDHGDGEVASYVYLLQSALAFEGVEVWKDRLDGLAVGEYEVDCPDCSTTLFVVLGEHGFFATSVDYAGGVLPAGRTPLEPVRPDTLTGLARRLHATALAHRQPAVADLLTYLFGRATCDMCGHMMVVGDAVADRPW